MIKTIVRRFLMMIPQLFILSIIVFLLAKLMPGDPFTGMIGNVKAEVLAALREKSGIYDPWYVQYMRWIKNAIHGDFGISYAQKLPVSLVIGERIWNTFFLSFLSLIMIYALAIPLGVIAAKREGEWADRIITFYNFLTFSIPIFVFSLLMLWLFGFQLHWFPTSGSGSLGIETGTVHYWLDKLYHALLPALSTTLISTVGITQYLRSEIVDAKRSDYVMTARGKGVSEADIYTKHIFRNAFIPIATFLGYSIVGLLSGSIFLEVIFGYTGMGQLFISSIISRDYSVITTLVLFYGFLGLLGTLLSDIILTIVDPRIRIQ